MVAITISRFLFRPVGKAFLPQPAILKMFIQHILVRAHPKHWNMRSFGAALIHLTPKRANEQANYWDDEDKYQKKKTNFDLAKSSEKDEEECFYPLLRSLGISTTDRNHHLNFSCDSTIKFIKLGAINKNIAIQYCHYLAEICKLCSEHDFSFYSKRAFDLMLYIIRHSSESKDITDKVLAQLLCDVASISPSHCSIICDQVLAQFNLIGKLGPREMSKLLKCCYKHGLWKTADRILVDNKSSNIIRPNSIDPFVESIVSASSKYLSLTNQEEKIDLRSDVMGHLLHVLEFIHRDRVQFITKKPSEFAQALQNLDIKITKNPVIKMSGRCTKCDTHLNMYNHKETSQLNKSILNLLNQGGKGLKFNAPQEDTERFLKFLDQLYQRDKKPIDLVIDGLNLAYRNTTGYTLHKQSITDDFERTIKRHNPSSLTNVLVNTILRNDILKRYKKILVIGREHMRNWPGLVEFFVNHNLYFYASGDTTKDDLFQLYAATLNPKTIIATNDFFRDHLALVEAESRVSLERWIDTHQTWIINRNLKAIWPTPFEKMPTVDRASGRFHIPVINYNLLDTLALHEPPPHLNTKMVTWLCCHYEKQTMRVDKEVSTCNQ